MTVPVAAARSPRDFGVAKALVTAEAVRCDGDGANVGRPFSRLLKKASLRAKG